MAAIGMAMLAGLVLGAAGAAGAAVLTGVLLCGLVLALPWPWLLALMLVVVYALVGPAQYMAGVGKAFWLPYLMSVVVGLRVMADAGVSARTLTLRRASAASSVPSPASGAEIWTVHAGVIALGLFVMAAVLSSVVHRIAPLQALVGGKEYLFLWVWPAAFATGLLTMRHLRWLPAGITAWLTLQWPVTAWQRFVVAPQRGGDSPWDAVVGLFAGQVNSGGGSGTMAMVSLWAAALVVLAWRAGQTRGWMACWAVLAASTACALAEVKFALILLPLLGMMCAWPMPGSAQTRHLASPWSAPLSALVGSVLLVAALLMAYQWQYADWHSAEHDSLQAYAQTALSRNLQTDTRADEHGQLTRLGALHLWWREQEIGNLAGWWLGHGMGATRRSLLGVGEVAARHTEDVGRHTLSILLWEVGVWGTLCWTAGVAWLGMAAWRLRRQPALHDSVWLLQGAAGLLGISLLSLPYGADLMQAPQLAMAVMVAIGVVLDAYRKYHRVPAATSGSGP